MTIARPRSSDANTAGREIVLTRVFDAPRELVWKAWTDPAHISEWWGPRGFTTTIHEMDLRRDGVWKHTMHGPDGTNFPHECIFVEVVEPERIVYTQSSGREGASDFQCEFAWMFEEQGERTKLTLRMLFSSPAALEHVVREYGAIEGATQTFDRFAEYLAKNSIVSRR